MIEILVMKCTIFTSSHNSSFSNLPPPKTTCAACLFFILGLSFLIAGIVLYWGGTHQKDKGFTFLILGGISKKKIVNIFFFINCLLFC